MASTAGVAMPARTACSRRSMTAARGGSACPARRGSDSRCVLAGGHVLQGLERGSRRAQHDGHRGALRAQDGEIARRIAKAALVLLERGVVFFVDDDDAEIGDRREHRRARAEHDARRCRSRIRARRRAVRASVRPECSTATVTAKRSRKRATSCGVSPISGTSTRARRSCRRQCSTACRYTSVLPLPVMPCSRKGAKLSGGAVDGGHGGGLLGAECGPGGAQQRAIGLPAPRRAPRAEDAKPRATSARIGVRQSRESFGERHPPRCPGSSRRISSSSRWRRRAIQRGAVERRDACIAGEPAFGERT